MKKKAKRILCILLAIFVLCIIHSNLPTLGKQIRFNKWAWNHYPVKRIRYYMSDSVLNWLNTEKPSIQETVDVLGNKELAGSYYKPGDTSLEYFLMTPPFLLVGLDMYVLCVFYNDDGSFESADVQLWD